MQHKRRTPTVAPAGYPPNKEGNVKTTDLEKQLSELRQLRQRVQAAEAARIGLIATSTRPMAR